MGQRRDRLTKRQVRQKATRKRNSHKKFKERQRRAARTARRAAAPKQTA